MTPRSEIARFVHNTGWALASAMINPSELDTTHWQKESATGVSRNSSQGGWRPTALLKNCRR